MANTVSGIHLGPDTHANRPAAGDVTAGTLYSCTDHDLVYRSDGSTWSTWADLTGGTVPTWADWTPTWTASTTNPTIGDGTLAGRYAENGKTVFFTISLTIGSTTNPGSGAWAFSLPVVPKSTVFQMAAARILDQGTDNKLAVALVDGGAGTISGIVFEGGNVVTHGAPITWAAGDRIDISGVYEAN